MRAAGESQRSPGPPRAFGPVLVRLNFKSRRQRSERQSAERFYAAAFRGSYRLKGRGVMISARATDLPSPRRRCAPRRSNSKSTRPRSLCPWWRAGPRSGAARSYGLRRTARSSARPPLRRTCVFIKLALLRSEGSCAAAARRQPMSAAVLPASSESFAHASRGRWRVEKSKKLGARASNSRWELADVRAACRAPKIKSHASASA